MGKVVARNYLETTQVRRALRTLLCCPALQAMSASPSDIQNLEAQAVVFACMTAMSGKSSSLYFLQRK